MPAAESTIANLELPEETILPVLWPLVKLRKVHAICALAARRPLAFAVAAVLTHKLVAIALAVQVLGVL